MWVRPPPPAPFSLTFLLGQVTEPSPISPTVPETVPAARRVLALVTVGGTALRRCAAESYSPDSENDAARDTWTVWIGDEQQGARRGDMIGDSGARGGAASSSASQLHRRGRLSVTSNPLVPAP